VPDRNGDRLVVGVDAHGALVDGPELFRRAVPGLAPMESARRAVDMLLAGHGAPLDPAVDKPIFSKEEWALVAAPDVQGGVLTFWTYQGEMAPQVVRIQVTLATGELARRPASWILHPPEAAIPGIRAKLHSKDKEVVGAGLHEVGEWKELAPDVEALLEFPDASTRMQAIGVLSNLHQERSVAALIRLLEQGAEWGDRSLAGQALVMRFGQVPGALDAVRAHVAKGGAGQEIGVLADVLRDWDAGKRY
jgi:HEAT repeat protein